MNWRENDLASQEDDRNKLVFYSTYYTTTNIIDRIKLYFKQFHYKPKH